MECSHGLYCFNSAVEQAFRRQGLKPQQDVRVLHKFHSDPIALMMASGNPHPSTNIATITTIIRGCLNFEIAWRWNMERLEAYPWVIAGTQLIRNIRTLHAPSDSSNVTKSRAKQPIEPIAEGEVPRYFTKVPTPIVNKKRYESADPEVDLSKFSRKVAAEAFVSTSLSNAKKEMNSNIHEDDAADNDNCSNAADNEADSSDDDRLQTESSALDSPAAYPCRLRDGSPLPLPLKLNDKLNKLMSKPLKLNERGNRRPAPNDNPSDLSDLTSDTENENTWLCI